MSQDGEDALSRLLAKEKSLQSTLGSDNQASKGGNQQMKKPQQPQQNQAPATGNSPVVQVKNQHNSSDKTGGDPNAAKKAFLEEKLKAAQAQNPAMKGQETKLIKDQKGKTATLNPEFLTDHATVYFKDCEDCNFTVISKCTKVLIERCKNTTVTFTHESKIMTQVVEIWKCENFTFNIATLVMTLQVDLCKGLNLNFKDKSYFNSIVWAGIYNLNITFENSPSDDLHTGFEQMKKIHPEINDQFDQFIVRFIDSKNDKGEKTGAKDLRSEMIVRLANGFPTTEREAAEWDAKEKLNKEKMEAYVRQLVDEKLPKLKTSGSKGELKVKPKYARRKGGLRNSGALTNSGNKTSGGKDGLKAGEKKEEEYVLNTTWGM
eukprot:TRINITY_DN1582_c0_g1_i1.p1 TRINITY_DN1582_c0_g1~~TRINITY_DN1582_c0_g1_i1.p1  ORF type:complete len:376 (+),score=119.31 TRINITY_DN1582_c0_g1_i1:206-1333(+)